MIRFLFWILIAAISVTVGCKSESDDVRQATVGATDMVHQQLNWRERYLELGRETYESACAECHDEGKDGSPTMGDRDSWANRSPLWSAVLIEHAKSGYLGMPAKGGQPELSDNAVQAAGEYMLSVTFPELPFD
jgi:cytochrome c5